ncbi:unnamed protein product [Acanthoscelides obtectus]|uniref:Transposase n=1 Tax=Acanthoscelides obtectus TaxID=200917 RepID=A0A9P0JJD1_ACAOB|nr:unnamed protein product [Acanthoscelides obtectus]CAK1678821.1 hypothetical protein AOBTE_LOCUS32033 [Acanthoscelides obtectus]
MSDLRSDLSEMESEPFQSSGSEYIVNEKVSESDDTDPEEESAGSVPPKGKRVNKTNKIKDYFIIEQDPKSKKTTDKQGKCTLCVVKNTVLKMKNCGTSSLRRHLQAKHTRVYENIFGKSSPPKSEAEASASSNRRSTITNWLEKTTSCSENFQQDKFQKLLVEYIAQKYLPFNFFEDAISGKMYKFLNPKATLPGRNQMKSLTLKTFAAAQQTIKSFMKTCNSKISFTIDGWSSFNMKGYYGITAHFFDKNWKLHCILLDFVPAHGQHTGNAIAKLFFEVLQFYDVTKCIQGITTDNTNSNFRELQTHISEIDTKNIHFVCFAHILNLAARDFMKILDSEVEETANILTDISDDDDDDCQVPPSSVRKIHSLAKKLKYSEHLRENFEKFCTTLNLKFTMPKLNVITRWNSTLDMLRWSLNMRNALNILCDNVENLKTLKPTDTEWSLIERICQYLNVFKSICIILEGESYASLPMVIIGINMLLDRLESWAMVLDNKPDRDEIDEKIINSIQAARDKIIRHYERTNWMYCVVLILDPRHKVDTFSNTSWGKELQIEAIKHFEDIFKAQYFRADSLQISEPSLQVAASSNPSRRPNTVP